MIAASDALSSSLEIDVAIVGGGAAGLTLAASLAGTNLRVALFEAGGLRDTSAGRASFRGESVGDAHPALHHFRVRAVGGASRIWGGRCVPFDEIDFEARPWVPGSGWPIARAELIPFYQKAHDALELGRFAYDPEEVFRANAQLLPGLEEKHVLTTLERFSRPTDLWKRHKAALRGSTNISLLTHAPIRRIAMDPDGRRVDHLELVRRDGTLVKVKARMFVLAAGGLETTRLLLDSIDVQPHGIGNEFGHLGRYYMSHLAATAGALQVRPGTALQYAYGRDDDGVYVRRRLQLSPPIQREARLLNAVFRTHIHEPSDPAHLDPVLSAMYLVKHLLRPEYSLAMRTSRSSVKGYTQHVANVARHPGRLLRFSTIWMIKRNLARRRLPSLVLGSTSGLFPLEFHGEQSPNSESRVTLGSEVDSIGMRRLKVDWRINTEDLSSLERSYSVLAMAIESSGSGTLAYEPGAIAAAARAAGAYGGHHLGTTRISHLPKDGVVDVNCRVHSTTNLFVASGSVLPTSSQANPTLTIVALALRLSEHIRREANRLQVR